MVKAVLNTFIVLSALLASLVYDISSHGSLESSRTGRILKDTGLLIHVKPYYTVVEKNAVTWFKWGKKNFPHEKYQLCKDKTLEITKNFGETIMRISKDTTEVVKKYSSMSYDYVISKMPPDFSEKMLKFLSNVYETISNYTKVSTQYITEQSSNGKKWLLENVSKDSFTWKNVEKVYFEAASKIGILYTDFTSWVGRKIECLMSS